MMMHDADTPPASTTSSTSMLEQRHHQKKKRTRPNINVDPEIHSTTPFTTTTPVTNRPTTGGDSRRRRQRRHEPTTTTSPPPTTITTTTSSRTTSNLTTINTNPFLSKDITTTTINDTSSTTTPRSTTTTNDDDDGIAEQLELLNHLEKLTSLRTTTSIGTGSGTSSDDTATAAAAVMGSLQYMVHYLQQQQQQASLPLVSTHNNDSNNNFVSCSDILQVVVPWCVTYIFQPPPPPNVAPQQQPHLQRLVWEVLYTSISMILVLLQPSTTLATTTTPLPMSNVIVPSQSTLFKLIPKMIYLIMTTITTTTTATTTYGGMQMEPKNSETTTNDDDDDDDIVQLQEEQVVLSSSSSSIGPIVISTYNLVLPLFQPTMEVACKHVLLPLLSSSSLSSSSHIQPPQQQQPETTSDEIMIIPTNDARCSIVPSTIRWIHSIHTSRKGNPKTTFQLFANRTILEALSQCYTTMVVLLSSVPPSDDNDNEATMRLFKELIYDIYFHPKHHMEGFIALLRQPMKQKNTSSADGNINNTTNNNDFKTYHYDLFDTIQLCLMDHNNNNRGNESNEGHPSSSGTNPTSTLGIGIIPVLPIIYQGFVQQSNIYWNNSNNNVMMKKGKMHNNKNNSNSNDTMTKVQYQLFIRWTRPLLSVLVSLSPDVSTTTATTTALMVLTTIRQMLQIVFDCNIYVPATAVPPTTTTTTTIAKLATNHEISIDSNADSQHHQRLLKDIVSTIFALVASLKMYDDDAKQMHSLSSSSLSSKVATVNHSMIHCLQIIFKLHHVLLQDRMIDALQLCLHDADGNISSSNDDIGIDFIVTMISTYRQLRQQRLIFQTIFAAVDRFVSSSPSRVSMNSIHYLIQLLTSNPKIINEFSYAVSSCPIEEMKSIFHTCNDWMTQTSKNTDEKCDLWGFRMKGLGVMIPLLTIITRNVRVLIGTARDIAICCQLLNHSSITKLSDSTGSDDNDNNGLLSISMILTGLLVELHMHCVFWLGRSEELILPTTISNRLNSFNSDDVLRDCDSNQLYESILFLSCHRLKQLHSLIYDQEVSSMEKQTSNDETIAILTKEAHRIASFIANGVDFSNSTKEHRWISVAQNISSWIVYAKNQDIIQFLKWVVIVASKSMLPSPHIDKPELTRTGVFVSQSTNMYYNLDESEVVKSLLTDSAFFQYAEIDSSLTTVGLSLVAELLSNALLLNDSNSCQNIELRSLIETPLADDAYQRLDTDAINKPDHKYRIIKIGNYQDTSIALRQALNVAILVVNLPMSSCSGEDELNILDLTLRLDNVCLSIECDDIAIVATLTSLATSLRLLQAQVFAGCSESSEQDIFHEYLPFPDILFAILDSTRIHISRLHGIEDNYLPQLMEATGSFIESLFENVQYDAELAQQLRNGFSHIKPLFMESNSMPALAYVSRRIVVSIKTFAKSQIESFASFFNDIWDVAIYLCEAHYTLHQTNTTDKLQLAELPIVPFSLNEGFLLLGDLVSTKTTHAHAEKVEQVVDELNSKCMLSLRKSTATKLALPEWNSLSYLTGRIAAKRPTIELVECILYALDGELHCKYNVQVLEACICHMVPTLTRDNLLTVVGKLSNYSASSHTTTRRLRLLKLFLRYAPDASTTELLSSVGRNIFMCTVSGLCIKRSDPNWSETIIAACTLLEELIRRRDQLPLKEVDLALILSYIVGVLGPVANDSNNEGDVSETEELAVFTCAADLCVTTFQRYSKQLYVCVPSVIALMHILLCHAMHDSYAVSRRESIALRSQHFTRICELLVAHKDVYKKHVVGLVLKFISGVEQATLSLQCRDALTPAIYFLLDCMSTFEMQQLNAHMNSKAKILFRNVHQNYLKIHTYNGQ